MIIACRVGRCHPSEIVRHPFLWVGAVGPDLSVALVTTREVVDLSRVADARPRYHGRGVRDRCLVLGDVPLDRCRAPDVVGRTSTKVLKACRIRFIGGIGGMTLPNERTVEEQHLDYSGILLVPVLDYH